jgi:glycosyltransferase involved in cell wall biosynthesis
VNVSTLAVASVRPVIVLPTYNNIGTLPNVVDRCARLELPMLAIDDGSTDATAQWLASNAAAGSPGLTVITHPHNRGKAAALRTGFSAAIAREFSHAITIDTDGQLSPEEIPILLSHSRAEPRALVLGVRDDRRKDYPWRSRVGRWFSNYCLFMETGVRITDSQCGLRIYPLGAMTSLKCQADRFGYETEIIARAAWAGCPIIEVPVSCRYFDGERRITHFRPGKDSLKALAMHSRLLCTAFFRRL